jgi:uncharacterized RDD family membrane protein YckC
MIRLKIQDKVIELAPGEYTVGRSQQCDVTVDHETVSRQHARLYVEEHRAFIEDLGSSNGTFINGKPIQGRTPLAHRDRLHLGKALIEVELPTPPSEAPTMMLTDQPAPPSPPPDATIAFETPSAPPPIRPEPPPPAAAPRPVPPPPPAATPRIATQPHPVPAGELPLAGVGARFLAVIVDGLIVGVPWVVIGTPMVFLLQAGSQAALLAAVGLVLAALLGFILALWNDVYLPATRGYSIGKKLLGLRIYTVDGQSPIGMGKALIRFLGRIPSGMCLYLGYLWALFDDRRQTWHDKFAGTLVVRMR